MKLMQGYMHNYDVYNFINIDKCMNRRGGVVVERAPLGSIIGRDRPKS